MKTKHLFLIGIICLLVTFEISASNSNLRLFESEQQFATYLSQELDYPIHAKEKSIEGFILADISANPDGSLHVDAINGHPLFVESIRTQIEELNYFDFDTLRLINYCIKIHFQIK